MQIDEDVSGEKLVFQTKSETSHKTRGDLRPGMTIVRVVKLRFIEKSVPAPWRQRIFDKSGERLRGKLKSSQVRL